MTTTSRFLEIVQKLGPRFAARAAAADVEGRFVRDNYADLKEAREATASIVRVSAGVVRMRRLIDDLLAYTTARDAALKPQPLDRNAVMIVSMSF